TGVWNPKTLSIPGETMGHVHYAIHYLKSPQSFHMGDNVVVIGAGNVAMDAARTAKRLGAKEVTILYRKDFDWMKATKAEIQETLDDGVTFTLYRAPKAIDETGIVTVESRKVEREDGSVDFVLIEGSELHHEADAILVAISQGPRSVLVNTTQELQANRWGLLVSDEDGHTTKANVYACGDVVTGAKTVVDAVARAKRVAQTMQQELRES
ncbi:MAG: FAD-dependent oxidoreductase, partial [Erysipelotrichaceae bacterium]